MTPEQRQRFEAYTILEAHTRLLLTIVSQGTVQEMQAQLVIVQDKINEAAKWQASGDAAA